MKRASLILFVALVALVALAGCATKPAAIEVRTVEVPVIRVERCIAPGDVPKRPSPLLKRPATISAALDTALAKVLEWQSYGDRASAVLKGCAG